MTPSWNCVSCLLDEFPHTFCLLPHRASSKSVRTDAVTVTILNSLWWQTDPLWSRPLLFGCTYSITSSTAGSNFHTLFWGYLKVLHHVKFVLNWQHRKLHREISGQYWYYTPVECDVWLIMLRKWGWVHWHVLWWWICCAPGCYFLVFVVNCITAMC